MPYVYWKNSFFNNNEIYITYIYLILQKKKGQNSIFFAQMNYMVVKKIEL